MKNTMNSKQKSIILLNIAVMMFGLSGVMSQFVDAPSAFVAWGRVAFSICILFVILLIRKENFRLDSRKDYIIALLAGVTLAAHWTTFFQSIHVSSVAIGTITFSTFPLFLTFLEPIVYKEKLKMSSVLCSIVLLVGVFITIPEFSLSNNTTEGIIWGMICSFLYAVLALMNRHLSSKQEHSGTKICFYEQTTAFICLLPAVFILDISWNIQNILCIAVIGVLCTALAYTLFVVSQKTLSAQTAGVVSGLETVYGIILAFFLLGEMPAAREIIGGCVILAAATFSVLTAKTVNDVEKTELK